MGTHQSHCHIEHSQVFNFVPVQACLGGNAAVAQRRLILVMPSVVVTGVPMPNALSAQFAEVCGIGRVIMLGSELQRKALWESQGFSC